MKTILSKLQQALAEIKAVEKAHKFTGGTREYWYRSIEDVLAEYHRVFAKYGILVIIGEPNVQNRGVIERRYKDSVQRLPLLDCWFRLSLVTLGENGEKEEISTIAYGSAIADDDKYTGKLISYGVKYALTTLMTCPYEDMPDTDKAESDDMSDKVETVPALPKTTATGVRVRTVSEVVTEEPDTSATEQQAGVQERTQMPEKTSETLDKEQIEKICLVLQALGVDIAEIEKTFGPKSEWTEATRKELRKIYLAKKK